ncbi:MAG: nuclear transport factor 2 family protein [Saprospiraceae bacterium]
MQRFILTYLSILFIFQLQAQSELAQIEATVNDYINGTSYNQVEVITRAFHPESDLFLDGKDGKLWIVPSKEYISWFEKNERDVFNGRIGRILSVEHFGNIAMAKAEILLPKIEKRFIDMFILKKVEGAWKIISKTANSEVSNRMGKKVLFVVSNADRYGDTELTTGNSFSEITNAYHVLDQAGIAIDFVSPAGGAVPLAYINTSDAQQRDYVYNQDFMYALKNTKTPTQVKAADYEAIYYVGGGAAMFGTPENTAIQQLAMDIYEKQNGIVAAICHGTAGIAHLKTSDGKYLVDGKTVSGYPESFERQESDHFKTFPFLIQKTIEKHGGTFKVGARNTPFMQTSKRVITGQNHLSAQLVAEQILQEMGKEKM